MSYYELQPKYDCTGAKALRDAAKRLLQSDETSTNFIDHAVKVVLGQVVDASKETVTELANAIAIESGESGFDGTDVPVAFTWAGDALEAAGIGGDEERDQFDEDDADMMVFVPQMVFETIIHEAAEKLCDMIRRAA